MTDPHFNEPRPPQGGGLYPHSGGYGAPQPNPAFGYGDPAPGAMPMGGGYAPYGVDPRTGQPLSDKSKVAAGLLQLFLGGFGAGRFYIGSIPIAVTQLCINAVGWFLFFLGFLTLGMSAVLALLLWTGLGIWTLVDAIMMFTGSVRDGQGRMLRS